MVFNITKGRKIENKNMNKEHGQQIENSNKFSRYQSNYINNHLKH